MMRLSGAHFKDVNKNCLRFAHGVKVNQNKRVCMSYAYVVIRSNDNCSVPETQGTLMYRDSFLH
ncbi:hypothetical protein NECAME_02908 [Necator americanus]|uniref:Uncharacterized protein n=1 Tax=Necator americanus TaxID=51031 RepID=W2TB94_NECAM|nr:hypothetical protein NECAME_02908 [Necator americanus]ETN78471.1 hypothetical protein NECAME_02908 [Necator americanus]